MSRLFLKMFLSFWLITVMILLASTWLHVLVLEGRVEAARPMPEPLRSRLERLVDAHVRRLEQGLPLPRGRGPGLRMIHVIDGEGRDSNPLPLPRDRRFLAALDAEPGRIIGPDYIAQTVETRGGRRLRVVALAPLPPRLLATGRGGALLRLGVALLVSLGACWLLAWRLSRPLERLRHTASELAAGDLSRRVSPDGRYRGDEIGALGRTFDRMAAGLEAAARAQQRLLRDVSHELRSPLARLEVALELARDAPPEEEGRQLDRIARESERLNGLIGDILELSRRSADASCVLRVPVSLGPLLEQIAEDARFEGQRDAVAVELACDGPVELVGDPVLLARAVENVVRNALAHAPAGSAVEIALRREHDRAVVIVSDRGRGVPEADLERIFEPFHRIDEARSPDLPAHGSGGRDCRPAGGHGIGLAIARAAVEAHGGSIGARIRPGGGLAVRIRLPVAALAG